MRTDDFLEATLGAMNLVHNLARRLVRDPHAAEDVVQETYLAAFRSWRRHRRPHAVEPWLATICLNVVRSDHRRKLRRPSEVLEAEPALFERASSDTAAEALAKIDQDAIHRALWELPEEQRIAITLVDICDLTAAETAKVMGTPRGTVLSRVHRGRIALAARVRGEVREREEA